MTVIRSKSRLDVAAHCVHRSATPWITSEPCPGLRARAVARRARRHGADPHQQPHCAEGHRPVCQDTGIVNAFVKLGMDARFDPAPGEQPLDFKK